MAAQGLRALGEEVLLPLFDLRHGQPILAGCIGRGDLASDQIQNHGGLSLGRPSLDLSF
jgi:hypothetical protein